MPSVFDLFGTISLDTRNFDGSIKAVESRLKGADAQLDKVISTSNKLGDTSATVAQRYNKLNSAIEAQKQKLIANALAFEKGEITAKQFGNVLVQVDRQTAALTSRLKDASARATELAETNLTHFQQQIKGAIGDLDKGHSLINLNAARPLQGLGPVLNGLGARKYGVDETILNIMIVAARQAGILKVAQEGAAVASAAVAASTEVAAVAEAKLYKASELAAIYSAETAVATEATAVAAAETVTIFGLGLGPLIAIGAALAAAVSTILLVKKASEELLNVGKERLKTEEAVTASINEQYLSIVKLKKELADDQGSRNFDRFLKNAGSFELGSAQSDLQAQFEANAKAVVDEKNRRSSAADDVGLKGQSKVDYINDAVPKGFADSQKAIQDQIKALAAKRDENKQSQSPADFIKGVQDRQVELFKQGAKDQEKAAKDASDAQKKAAEAARKLAEALEKAGGEVVRVFGQTTDNPFSKILEQRAAAVLQLRDAFKDIGLPDIHRRLKGMINEQTERSTVGQRISTNLSILGLQEGYEQFSRGTTDSSAVSFYKQALANPNLRGDLRQQYTRDLGYVQSDEFHKKLKDQVAAVYEGGKGGPQDVIDKQLLGLAQNIKPEQLDRGEQKTFADAFLREIKHKAVEEKEAKERDKEMGEILKKLSAGSLNTVTFKDESNSVKSITSATPSATADRYSSGGAGGHASH